MADRTINNDCPVKEHQAPIRQVVAMAAAVASLGASLGANVGEALAMNKTDRNTVNTSRGEVNQFKEVNQYKFYQDGTTFKLKANDNSIVILEGRAVLYMKTGARSIAGDGIYELQDGSKLLIKGGQVVQ